ncbi:hypothetical protein ACLOJK_036350 [Asimina triloba]
MAETLSSVIGGPSLNLATIIESKIIEYGTTRRHLLQISGSCDEQKTHDGTRSLPAEDLIPDHDWQHPSSKSCSTR